MIIFIIGIPDFRSPKIGLYAQLKTFGLPHPEEIFSLEYLEESPQPFYVVANRYLQFKAKPSQAHYFIKRFADEKILYMDYTQNIDGLELDVGIPSKYLVQAHGHMRTAHCMNQKCKSEANIKSFQRYVKKEEVMYCLACKSGIVKPDIVFFGEKLPTIFRTKFNAINKADLVFVMGTSLKVRPFSTLLNTLPTSTPLIVINYTNPCHNIVRENLLFLSGDIEDTVVHLMRDLGWISLTDNNNNLLNNNLLNNNILISNTSNSTINNKLPEIKEDDGKMKGKKRIYVKKNDNKPIKMAKYK